MKVYIKERTLEAAKCLLENKLTIRKTAKLFGLSKSTLHYDLSTRLRKIDENLYQQVKQILDQNFEEKHIRGGEATKKKYSRKNILKLKNQ